MREIGQIVYITHLMRRWLVGVSEGKSVLSGAGRSLSLPSMRRALIGSVLLLMACPSKPTAVDAGLPDAGPIEVVDAGPPAPVVLVPTITATFVDGGSGEIKTDGEVDQPKSLTIALPAGLSDFRLRVLDWRDQVVASDDELLSDGKTYLITFVEPLKTGRSYQVLIDAELGPVVTTEAGATVDDFELRFRVAGDVVPDPPAPGSKKRKR